MILAAIRTMKLAIVLLAVWHGRAGIVMPAPEMVELDSLEEIRPTRLKGVLFRPYHADSK